MEKKSMLVSVNEEKFEQCRKLVEKTWGLKLSNSDLVDYIANYYVVTTCNSSENVGELRKKIIDEILEIKRAIYSRMGKGDVKFKSTPPSRERHPLRTIMEAYKEKKK